MAAVSTIAPRRRARDNGAAAPEAQVVRCAVYVRVSVDDKLDQPFNSLHAQREACETFIQSQPASRWVCLPEAYDDGGYGGGSLERPALRRLLTDIDAHRIDILVVHRIDRLSRSLLDFAQLLERLRVNQVAFVSVNEQFDTSTPAGQLHMNVLMSFAEYERQLIRQRTSQKMSAARRRGQWTGGRPTLGFDVAEGGGRLLINEPEAERVRSLFALYLELGSLSATVAECRRRGWTMKRWTTQGGKVAGGGPMTKSSLQHLLRNPVLVGKVHSRGELFPGEHPAIVDEATWQAVQDELRANAVSPEAANRYRHDALLAGLLHCKPCGCAITHTSTKRRNRVFRYYTCVRRQKEGRAVCRTVPVSAGEMEGLRRATDQGHWTRPCARRRNRGSSSRATHGETCGP